MKIIAITFKSSYGNGSRFLVEMDDNELALIAGKGGSPEIGATFEVRENYNLLRKHEQSQADLAGAVRTLRALADLCEQQAPSLVLPPPPSKPE